MDTIKRATITPVKMKYSVALLFCIVAAVSAGPDWNK
jgi:hypothetical protein